MTRRARVARRRSHVSMWIVAAACLGLVATSCDDNDATIAEEDADSGSQDVADTDATTPGDVPDDTDTLVPGDVPTETAASDTAVDTTASDTTASDTSGTDTTADTSSSDASATDTSDGDAATPPDATAVGLSGEDRTYRLTGLSLREPDIMLRAILSTIINTSIDLHPSEPEAVHILLRFSAWDTTTTPPTLTLESGAGVPDLTAEPIVYSFRSDAEVVAVPSTYAMVEGLDQIANSLPTNLIIPFTVATTASRLPLRDVLIQACYGTNRDCGNADGERLLYGSLTGGIVAAEAEAVEVELSPGEPPLSLAEILRDPTNDCTVDTDCLEGRACAAASGKCERLPDVTIKGEPAFSVAAIFKAEEVGFSAQ